MIEEQNLINSSWECGICTYINEPYCITGNNVCEMCEGPSPWKLRK